MPRLSLIPASATSSLKKNLKYAPRNSKKKFVRNLKIREKGEGKKKRKTKNNKNSSQNNT